MSIAMSLQGSWPPDLPGQPPGPGQPPPEIPWPVRPPPGPSTPPAPIVVPGSVTELAGIDVRDHLLDQRRILVSGFLDDAAAMRAAAELMMLDGRGDDAIEIHFSCPDGDLNASQALADTIDFVHVLVRAWCRGGIGGPALAPYTAADHRLASAFAVFHLHDPSVQSSGLAGDLEVFARHHQHQVDALHRRIAIATGQTPERVAADFATGTALDAEQAHRYGIVHEVSGPGARPVATLPRPG